jgi:hypothetical protein
MAEPITSSVTLTKQQAEDRQHAELFARIAALESELAALRQIVADVETCRESDQDGVEISIDFPAPWSRSRAGVSVNQQSYFHAPTWQAALHAAAEHVRNTNPERTGHEV